MSNKLCLGNTKLSEIYLGQTEVEKIYLGTHLVFIKSPYIYKWILNDELSLDDFSFESIFMSNGEEYEYLSSTLRNNIRVLEYNTKNLGDFPYNTTSKWLNNSYKVIYFKEKPSGDLLTWLTANGTKYYDNKKIAVGTYTFNDIITLPTNTIFEPIDYKFTNYGSQETGVSMNIQSNAVYYKTPTTTIISYQNSWQSTTATITIGTEQIVTDEFYTWFSNNNVKQ